MNCKSEIDLGPMKGADLLGDYNLSHVLRTLHIASGQKHYKVRYCVRRRNAKKHTMLTVISVVNGTTFREALNGLIKTAQLDDTRRILQFTTVFLNRHYIFVETPLAYDLEQILRVKSAELKSSGHEMMEPVLDEQIIGHILRKVLKALSFLHHFGLHNNIVTRSIYITNDCDVRLSGLKWAISKEENIQRCVELHGSRFFGCPRQWAPEEALKDVNNYGTYTEIWHVGLLIPEMVTGNTYHLTNETESAEVAEVALKLLKFDLPVPYNNWLPQGVKYSLSSELLKLWHQLMQPDCHKRPTISQLLDRREHPSIRSVSKTKIKQNLLSSMRSYRIPEVDQRWPMISWQQLKKFSRDCGTGDLTQLEPLYFGMGRKELFSPVIISSSCVDNDETSLLEMDFSKIPVDILLCVDVEVYRGEKKVDSETFALHLDMFTADINIVVCRHIFKLVKKKVIGLINYIRIATELMTVLRDRNRIKGTHRCWQIFLEEDKFNKRGEGKTIPRIFFDGYRAKEALSRAGSDEQSTVVEVNMPDSLTLDSYRQDGNRVQEDRLQNDEDDESSAGTTTSSDERQSKPRKKRKQPEI
uniref:non-specific serine/threonine protein kinase n=1 Tax=Parascaris univalens TaxID=6257 RepID=A0A915CKS9_PARUN